MPARSAVADQRPAGRRAPAAARSPARAGLAAQHPEQPAHVGQRAPGRAGDRGELGLGRLRQLAEPVRRGLRLHRDHRHVVGDHVVHLAGDPGPLLQHRPPGLRQLAEFGLLGQGPLALPTAPDQVADDQHGDDEHGDPVRVGQVGTNRKTGTRVSRPAQAATPVGTRAASTPSTNRKPMICTGFHGQGSFAAGVDGAEEEQRVADPPGPAADAGRPAPPAGWSRCPARSRTARAGPGCPAGTGRRRRSGRSAPAGRAGSGNPAAVATSAAVRPVGAAGPGRRAAGAGRPARRGPGRRVAPSSAGYGAGSDRSSRSGAILLVVPRYDRRAVGVPGQACRIPV